LIFITVKFRVLPEHADRWPEVVEEFTRATRAEPGCLWFDWSRSIEDPAEYVLVEAFRDDEAGAAHVGSAHAHWPHRSPGGAHRRSVRTPCGGGVISPIRMAVPRQCSSAVGSRTKTGISRSVLFWYSA